MKTSLVTETFTPIRRVLSNAGGTNSYVPRYNITKSAKTINGIETPKFIKKIVNRLFKPKEVETVHSPIIAKMEMPYYRFGEVPDPKDLDYNSAQRKLAEIYVRQTEGGMPGYTVERNIEAMRTVPDVVKEMIKPLDIQADGHIDQNTINKAYDIAKKAKKISPYEYPPMFAGKPTPINQPLSTSSTEPILLRDNIDNFNPEYNRIFEDLDDNLHTITDSISMDQELSVDKISSVLDSDFIEQGDSIVKKVGNLLDGLSDIISDTQ